MGEGTTQFFHSRNIPGTDMYTWTLTTRLGEMLQIAEELFGKRDLCYTPLGIEFYGEIPMVWYPGNCKHIAIRLTMNAAYDCRRSLYQLAHETVHLLSPTGGRNSIYFEEGVATWFSNYYLERIGLPAMSPSVDSYQRVLNLVESYLHKDPFLVKRIRDKQPSFHKMTKKDIRPEFPGLSEKQLKFLVTKFQREADSTTNP